MSTSRRILIVSDIHYASDGESRRRDYEARIIGNSLLRFVVRVYRRYIWLRDPFAHNDLLHRFLQWPGTFDAVIANGDYSCDTAFVGVSDPAACLSARQCLERMRSRFGAAFRATMGDHELGKVSLFGGQGGMRLASWQRSTEDLGLSPFWKIEFGNYVLIGITSSLVALPVNLTDTLAAERPAWEKLREAHLADIRAAFRAIKPEQRVLLFCHDPTALPFLGEELEVRAKLHLIERTIIGHLHSNLILWESRLLCGMPSIAFLGNSIRRMSTALHRARCWQPFKVLLCPALAGIELLKDGGFYSAQIDCAALAPAKFQFHPLRR